jgi:hypothetical protein
MRFFFVLISSVSGYFHETHSFLGNLLSHHLQKNLRQSISSDLGTSHFESASTWADRIKRNHKYDWAKPLHYIDSECKDKVIDIYCKNNCVFTAILNITNELKYNKEYLTEIDIQENLKFLLHFLQDFNQPMHLLGMWRGGNDYNLYLKMPDGTAKRTNIHTLWDSIIPEYYLDNYRYSFPGVQMYNISSMTDYSYVLLKFFENNMNFACQHIITSHNLDFNEYFSENMMPYLFDSYLNLAINTFSFIYS